MTSIGDQPILPAVLPPPEGQGALHLVAVGLLAFLVGCTTTAPDEPTTTATETGEAAAATENTTASGQEVLDPPGARTLGEHAAPVIESAPGGQPGAQVPRIAHEPQSQPEPGTAAAPGPEPAASSSATGSRPQEQPEPEPTSVAEPEPGSEPGRPGEPKPESGSVAESDPEPEPEVVTAPGTERQPEPEPEPVAPPRPDTPPENPVLARNFLAGGSNHYLLDLAAVRAKSVAPGRGGVEIVCEDGHRVVVPRTGKPVFEAFRDSLLPTDGKSTYVDTVAGYFVVAGLEDPSVLNEVIKDVGSYPSYFNDRYKYSVYLSETTALAPGPHSRRLEANQREVRSGLEPWRYEIEPSGSRFLLRITIGKGNWFERAEVNMHMISTSYVLRDETGAIIRIVNENELVEPDSMGGAQKQNVVWVMEPVPGVGVLARYYQCSVSRPEKKGPTGTFQKARVKLTQLNVIDYMQGIHDRTKSKM